jgi:hypothetical protein
MMHEEAYPNKEEAINARTMPVIVRHEDMLQTTSMQVRADSGKSGTERF